MRIFAIYRHYWPDATPYARLLKNILEEQVRQGHEVAVLCGQPTYNDIKSARQPAHDVVGGVQVRRLPVLPERKRFRLLRAFNYGLFLLQAVFYVCIRRNCDVIIANAQPPILMGVALCVIKAVAGIPYILHVQDIHPESAALAGHIKRRWWLNLLRRIDTISCRHASRLVTLSPDMQQTLLQRDESLGEKLIVLNNFCLSGATDATAHFKSESPNFKVIFAGNIGRFQSLDRLIRAVSLLDADVPLELTLMGAGSEVAPLQTLVRDLGLQNVRFVPYQTPEIALTWLSESDLGIVSLSEGICRVAYPSKTMSYAAMGCPVLAIVEKDCQLAHDIKQYRLGYVPEGITPSDIAEALRFAWVERSSWERDARQQLTARAESVFGQRQAMERWNSLFGELKADARIAVMVSKAA